MYTKFNENTFQEVNIKTNKTFSNIRGYGNILKTQVNDNKYSYESNQYNKLQNLVSPYGSHLPKYAEREYLLANPQTKISWKK